MEIVSIVKYNARWKLRVTKKTRKKISKCLKISVKKIKNVEWNAGKNSKDPKNHRQSMVLEIKFQKKGIAVWKMQGKNYW